MHGFKEKNPFFILSIVYNIHKLVPMGIFQNINYNNHILR